VRIFPTAIDPQSLHGVWFMTDVGSFDQPAENVITKFNVHDAMSRTENFDLARHCTLFTSP
jgi:hypothetical protein